MLIDMTIKLAIISVYELLKWRKRSLISNFNEVACWSELWI